MNAAVGGNVRGVDQIWANSLNRRNAFRALSGFLAGSPLLRSQQGLSAITAAFPGNATAIRTRAEIQAVVVAARQ